jgi:hypothetical protein
MPKEEDQTAKVGTDIQTAGPCNGCARRTSCLVRFAYDILAELEQPSIKQVHVLSSCNGFIPAPGADESLRDVRPELDAAAVTHLCEDCPETGVCGPHLALERLEDIAAKNGMLVTFTTICCKSTSAGKRPRRLLQILEPTTTEEE